MAAMNLRCFRLFAQLALATTAIHATAQHAAPTASLPFPVEIGANYTYLHTNLLQGCNCLALNGGDLQMTVGLRPRLQAVGYVGATRASGITPDGYAITEVACSFGLRYFPLGTTRLRPFGEALFGGVHALGSLSPGNNGVDGTSNAVSFITGGGIAMHLGSHIVVQPARVDYELTNFRNGQANHQNEIRLSTGVLYRFGSRKP